MMVALEYFVIYSFRSSQETGPFTSEGKKESVLQTESFRVIHPFIKFINHKFIT